MCETRRYLRQRGTWKADLWRLRRQGHSIRRVARELQALHPGLTFTRSVVEYWLAEPGRQAEEDLPPREGRDYLSARERKECLLRSYAAQRGLAGLKSTTTRQEVNVLAALRQNGPLTEHEIARVLRVKRLHSCHGYQRTLPALARRGLVEVVEVRTVGFGHVPVYRLPDRLLPVPE